MRHKAENEARDRYARHYAAVLAVEALIQHRAGTAQISIVVEAEDHPLWDDIVQLGAPASVERRHQVKRQLTPLSEDSFKEYVRAAAAGDERVHFHFAFPTMIDVADVGELRILHGLCKRVQQTGADKSKVIANLRDAERNWVDSLTAWTDFDEQRTLELLQRIHIDMIGLEDDLDNRALRLLEPVFGANTEEAWRRIRAFVSDKDGAVEIRPDVLWRELPEPAADEVDTFYWSFIEEVENSFILDGWPWLTSNLIRDLMPIEFHDKAHEFVLSVAGAAWPKRHSEIEAALRNLSERTHDYLRHFDSRCEPSEKWLREDKSYKRVFPNPHYREEQQASREWQRGGEQRLMNLVVALNELFAAVRSRLRPTYRLRDGKLGVHDQMGVTNHLEAITYYPEKYRD